MGSLVASITLGLDSECKISLVHFIVPEKKRSIEEMIGACKKDEEPAREAHTGPISGDLSTQMTNPERKTAIVGKLAGVRQGLETGNSTVPT